MSFPVDIFRRTVEKFTAILAPYQVRFHLTGGVTSLAYSEPRMTQDIDIVVDPHRFALHLEEIVRALNSSDFLFDETAMRLAIQQGDLFQILDRQEALKLAIYPRELIPGELGRSEMLEVFSGLELPIVSRADAAASKLVWVGKGSHKSRRDLRHLFRTSDAATQRTIRELAGQLQLQPLLDEVLTEPDEIQ